MYALCDQLSGGGKKTKTTLNKIANFTKLEFGPNLNAPFLRFQGILLQL